jgi:hypothetical protein
METPPPPPINWAAAHRRRRAIRIVFLLCACFLLFALFALFLPAIQIIRENLQDFASLTIQSYTDEFHVTVLEVKSQSNSFTERVRVRCEGNMDAGIWVTDLKEAGLFETAGANGEVFYREGHPHKVGQSEKIHADGKYSICEVLFTVNSTLNNTTWHSEITRTTTNVLSHGSASSHVDSTLSTPMVISGVQTNWPGPYQRGSAIPLADVGDYKILLTVK